MLAFFLFVLATLIPCKIGVGRNCFLARPSSPFSVFQTSVPGVLEERVETKMRYFSLLLSCTVFAFPASLHGSPFHSSQSGVGRRSCDRRPFWFWPWCIRRSTSLSFSGLTTQGLISLLSLPELRQTSGGLFLALFPRC